VKISLYVLARDEAANIIDCLAPLRDLFDDIVVADDASTDGMAGLLSAKLGITALQIPPGAFSCKAEARNFAIAHTRHPWALKLDADERLSREHAQRLLALPDAPDCAGYFCTWRTFADGAVVEDYKLMLARRDCIESGVAHENLQQDLRRRGLEAQWLHEVELLHYPDPSLTAAKATFRRSRLLAALEREPTWYRHHWFLGYMDYLAGDYTAAAARFGAVCMALPREFPVECLNSHMVLADIHAQRGDAVATLATLEAGQGFHARVRDDFEVHVNFRMRGWFEQALRDASAGKLAAVRAYLFAR
jgi:hypothetical protein